MESRVDLLHGVRHIAAGLDSDDHSRQEGGGLGDGGGVVDVHPQVVGHVVWTECGCSCPNMFLLLSSNQTNVQQVFPEENQHLPVKAINSCVSRLNGLDQLLLGVQHSFI